MVSPVQNQMGSSGMRPMGGPGGPPPPPRQDVQLSEEDKETIYDILSEYDSDEVTKEDALKIFEAFKEAGIQPGAGMKEAIQAAGFDAEELRTLGMPELGQGQPSREAPSMFRIGTSKGVDKQSLQSLQTILNQYDLTNLSETDESSLMSQLEEAGLLYPGTTIDIQS